MVWRGVVGRNSDYKLQPRSDWKALCYKRNGKEVWKAPVYFKLDTNMQSGTPRWTQFRLGEQTEVSTVVITYNYNFGFFFFLHKRK